MAKKILIIEDNPSARALEKELLQHTGYEVIEVSNSKDGIALAISELPDLILMDVRLPSKKRGIGAAKILRDNPVTAHIPIIFVTGYENIKDSNEVKSITNCSCVIKPFKIESFLEEVNRHLFP